MNTSTCKSHTVLRFTKADYISQHIHCSLVRSFGDIVTCINGQNVSADNCVPNAAGQINPHLRQYHQILVEWLVGWLGVWLMNGLADFFFFFFCGPSAVLRPSVHMLPGIGWCGARLPPFPTACWWLAHPAAVTGVSVSARRDSPGGCGGPSVLLLCNRTVQSL